VSNHAGVTRTLELLGRLKSTVRDFAAREEKLDQDWSAEVSKLRRGFGIGARDENARVSAEIAAAESTLQTERQRIASVHERRRSRIVKATRAAKKSRLKRIDDQESRRKYEIQRDLLQTGRNRDAELKRNEDGFENFSDALNRERESLVVLGRRARGCFRGYRKFLGLLSASPEMAGGLDLSRDENHLLEDLRALLAKSNDDLRRFRTFLSPLLFRFLPPWLLVPLILLIHISLVPVLNRFGIQSLSYRDAAVSMAAFLGAVGVLYFVGGRLAGPAAAAIAAALKNARRLSDACGEKSAARHQRELARITSEAEARTQTLNEQWGEAMEKAAEARETLAARIQQQTARVSATSETAQRQRLDRLERDHSEGVTRLKKTAEMRKVESEEELAGKEKRSGADYEIQWQTLAAEWKSVIPPLYEEIDAARLAADELFPEWRPAIWKQWVAPREFAHAAKFARMEVDVEKLCGTIPRDRRLALPGPTCFDVPLLLTFPQQGSILFETRNAGRSEAIAAFNNLILRLLSTAPPGRVSFTIIDPVELGQDFAGLMHLADYEERLINSRIWTQTGQIEQQLANLSEHIEKVTQMYLRNEYATITEYNEQAGRIAEKYHFLVVADFPVNFSDLAIKRLVSIAASGAKCGVYTFIHWDQRRSPPQDFVPDELRANSVCLLRKGDQFVFSGKSIDGTTLRLDSPPDPDLVTEFLHQVGRCSIDSNRVEMPFVDVAPAESELWSHDTTLELRVPIGRTGATKLQYLALGKGTRQHALIAGKTGSGKSTLFHVIITNLSLWCRPEQVEFYLVDFKKGVEFKRYATSRLPQARVVAIESDREFGLSVLQRVDEELKRRGDLFRKLGVQDIAGYRGAGGTAPVPRTLLIIDEFQEFFVEDDRVSQNAAVLLDRIVRQGRAFGVHVLLGSQTLGGAYTLARATLGQMVVRIALQCNEADAYLIMDENNAAPRLLSRPGEAIYNDAAGAPEGNSPFQVVWLPDAIRESYLDKVRELADRSPAGYSAPIVFEGNTPADVAENALLREVLEADSIKPVTAARIWLGAPNSIKGPTEAVFHRQSGNNLLMVGQRDEAALAILAVSLISLAAQHPGGTAHFVLLDCSPPGSGDFLEKVVKVIPHEIAFVRNADIDEIMVGLAQDMEKRSDPQPGAAAPATYLFIHGLQRFKKLRHEDDFGISLDATATASPGAHFNKLICEGTSLGIHVICTCDTVNNVNRFLSRKAVSEFELRVLFQMSANDSASLIDSPKAGNLGLHRAIFYNEQQGHLETFRPYALPDDRWIEQAGRNLSRLFG